MEIVRADASHEPAIIELATRTLGWEDDPRFRDLYRWKHDRNHFGTSPRWVALVDGRVAGFRVLMRWRFRRPDGSTVEAVRAVDTATDPDFQGRGIFRSLTLGAIEEVRELGVDLVFNTPNDQSRPGYLKMGWEVLGRPTINLVPRARSAPRIARSRTPAELWSLPCEVGRPVPEHLAEPGAADAVEALVAPWAADRWRTDRSVAFLCWRYGLEPLRYRALTPADVGGRHRHEPGLAIFRLRRRGRCVEATVAEVLAPSPGAQRALVRGVLSATGADYALVAGDRRLDTTPSVSLSSFSPLVTWRSLSAVPQPDLAEVRFGIGDLELF